MHIIRVCVCVPAFYAMIAMAQSLIKALSHKFLSCDPQGGFMQHKKALNFAKFPRAARHYIDATRTHSLHEKNMLHACGTIMQLRSVLIAQPGPTSHVRQTSNE